MNFMKGNLFITQNRNIEQRYFRELKFTYSALVWLLSCVSAHVNHKHVLGFERPLLSRALLPVTDKLFFLSMDVLIIDVLKE